MGRLKALALCHFDIRDCTGGGRVVVSSFLRELSHYFEVCLLSLAPYGSQATEIKFSQNLFNVIVPQNLMQAKKMWKLEAELGEGLFDVIQCLYLEDNVEFLTRVREKLKNSDIILFEHPWLAGVLELFKEEFREKLVLYHSIDNEYKQKLPLIRTRIDLQEKVRTIEKAMLSRADIILIPSAEEGCEILNQYGLTTKKPSLFFLPHSLKVEKIRPVNRRTIRNRKAKIGLDGKTTATFVGSWHPPNLEALEFLINAAKRDETIEYFILGSVKDYFYTKYPNRALPNNIHLLGTVSETVKEYIYACTDVAVNPMFSGAGINIKMVEYMAYGLPIVTTSFGARGIPGQFVVFEDEESFIAAIHELATDKEKAWAMINNNRKLVETQFDYKENVKRLVFFLLERSCDQGANNRLRYLYDRLLLNCITDNLVIMGVSPKDSFLVDNCAKILRPILY